MPADTFLAVDRLVHHYPADLGWLGRPSSWVRAVDGVSFSLNKGTTLAIVGESGCGKTTLARCILRLIEPSSGHIQFLGKDLSQLGPAALRKMRRHMQMIFQDPYGSLNPRKTIEQIIEDGFAIHGLYDRDERRSQISELLELVGLPTDAASRFPHEFSGGQRQRIGIARALALRPDLIVADEPVSSLDVSIQAQVLNLLLRLQRQYQLTYVLISHDLRVVRHTSDRTAVMYLGRIVEIADTESLFRRPQHPYTEALISAVPRMTPGSRDARLILEGDVPSPINPPKGCRFHPRCPRRLTKCTQLDPTLEEVGPGHSVACFYPSG